MKIGIVTYCEAVNYGAFLQAFSLGEYLKEKGHEVYYIKSFSFKMEYWKIHNLYAYHLDKVKFKNTFRKKWKQAQKCLNKTRKTKGYQLVVIGSDEMWQLAGKTTQPLPIYFGCGISADNIITYAVCSNGTQIDDVKKYGFIKEGIKNIKEISVRDKNTAEVYGKCTNKIIRQDIDPTFLIDLSKYEVEPKLCNYLLVYTYSFADKEVAFTKQFAEQNKLLIVTVGNKFLWSDISIPASPFEVLGLFHKAKYVITDTFHGVALSVHFNKEFYCFTQGKEKVIALLEEFNLKDRIVDQIDVPDQIKKIHYASVNSRIKAKQESAQKYLDKYLYNGLEV